MGLALPHLHVVKCRPWGRLWLILRCRDSLTVFLGYILMVRTSSVAPSLNSVVLVLLCVHVRVSCGSVVRWNLSEMVTELGSHLSKAVSLPGPKWH